MNKYIIKVVKRNINNGAKPITIVVDTAGVERKNRREAVAIVNNWVSESRENGRQERIFSATKISAWKAKPADLK